MTDFGSLITAMITPFQGVNSPDYCEHNSPVDYEATEKLVKHLIETGTESIVVAGTTGESSTLTHDEERKVFKLVKETAKAANPNVKIILGTGSNSTETVIASNKQAEALGADGVLIVVPYYNKPSAKGLKIHFDRIAKNTSLPIILYNIPGRTGIDMDLETTVYIVKNNPNIVGLKEASNNIDRISELRTKFDSKRFKIYSGDDSLTLPMMAAGANGVISVASHVAGKEMSEMISSFRSGNIERATEIHVKLFPLFKELFKEPNPTCVKAALNLIQICSPILREPLVQLTEDQTRELKHVLDATILKAVS